MSKSTGHYSGWVRREDVSGRFTAPIGQATTAKGHKVVVFAKPSRINEVRLNAALDEVTRDVKPARGSGS